MGRRSIRLQGNCYSNWNVATLCGGLSSFPPNLTDAGPRPELHWLEHSARCYRNVPADVVSHRRRGAGSVGAAVSASCAQGGRSKRHEAMPRQAVFRRATSGRAAPWQRAPMWIPSTLERILKGPVG